jgi:serine/threonine-protein kinase
LAKDHGKFVDWLKLIDFGLARDHGQQLTIAEGTPEYVAPETLQQQPVTPSSDLYALGVILHEMLTGQRPYQASSVNVMVSQHVNAAVPRVRDQAPDVSPELDELVFSLMSKEPSRRPGSASEVAKRLARLERELSDGSTGVGVVLGPQPVETSAPPAPAPLLLTKRATAEPTPLLLRLKTPPKRRWPWVVGAMVLLVLLTVVWAVVDGVEAAPPPVAAVAVVQPVPLHIDALQEDVVAPQTKPEVAAIKPIVVKKKKLFDVTPIECDPNFEWKRMLRKNLEELSHLTAGHKKQYKIFSIAEPKLSRDIETATTPSDCVGAQEAFERLSIATGHPNQ